MSGAIKEQTRLGVGVIIAATFLLFALWSARFGLPIFDEAFLLYGIDRVLAGEMPIADFEAYEPLRYYLFAPASALAGVTGVWVAGHGVVLTAALVVARTCRRLPVPSSLLTAALLPSILLFSIPRHKAVDYAISLLLVAAIVELLRVPDRRSAFGAGLAAGVAVLVGRNHGLYAGVAAAGALVVLHQNNDVRATSERASWLAAGCLAGCSPLLIALALSGSLRDRFIETFVRLQERGTNIPLPIPWPWASAGDATDLVSWTFVLLPLIIVSSLLLGVRARRSNSEWVHVALGASLVGLPYLHHAFARADVGHLAQAIGPGLVAASALSSHAWSRLGRARFVGGAALMALPLLATTLALPHWAGLSGPHDQRIAPVLVRGETRLLTAEEQAYLASVEMALVMMNPSDDVFVAPRDIGVYRLTDRRAPTWPLYMSLPASRPEQLEMIHDLATVEWFLLRDGNYGGNGRTAFRTSYPLVWKELSARCSFVTFLRPFEVRHCH